MADKFSVANSRGDVLGYIDAGDFPNAAGIAINSARAIAARIEKSAATKTGAESTALKALSAALLEEFPALVTRPAPPPGRFSAISARNAQIERQKSDQQLAEASKPATTAQGRAAQLLAQLNGPKTPAAPAPTSGEQQLAATEPGEGSEITMDSIHEPAKTRRRR